ncbi:MAG TPA: ABC-F family ATP-binding cassette domain-containing protein [Caulobacteraceae bacterium]|jgi:ATPase subunit of ABC transporter with duplicated ATPase domains|nr:ABC-F family ATP-binding cassette domain-containing protein [Caulobacteraceae bacterium]
MPSFITLAGVGFRTADGRDLFSDLNLAFARERTGLVGRNGVGKTTLLRLMLGELTPSEGAVVVTGRIGVLRQNLAPPDGALLVDLLGVGEALTRLRRIDRGEGAEEDLALADWALEERMAAAMADVGLGGMDPDRPAASMSGGEVTRARLAALLIAEPDLLLLDEPTNNLDAGARRLVAEVLANWRGGAVVVSHDRNLLRRMDRIVELSGLGVRIYGGGYDLYAERRAEERAAAAQALDAAERGLRQTRRGVQEARERKARRDAAGRRFAASGSVPTIVAGAMKRRAEATGGCLNRIAERQQKDAAETLEEAHANVERVKLLAFDLPSCGLATGRRVLSLDQVGFVWPGRPPLFGGVSFEITGPGRLAITGPNGSGKTTLLKLIAGELEPTSGRIVRGVPMALLDQRTAILEDDETILANFRRLNPADDDNACRAALARFLFRADAALRLVSELSGGERLRAALACVLAGRTPPQLLVLDEPTNHLDLDSIAAVEAAIAGYDGAVLAVSHDPDFLAAIGANKRVRL